jgi:beta-glucosidase
MGQQNDLAKAIFALGKPTVVFLLNGRPLSVNLLAERADALVECWYMGQETGNAVADLLFGRANPGGKLPVSIARSVGQLPIFYNHKPRRAAATSTADHAAVPVRLRPELHQLRSFRAAPGASATIGVGEAPRCRSMCATSASRRSDEVVQLYIRDDVSSVTRPLLELKAFQRVTLQPGEKRTLSFDIKPSDLWFYNTEMKRVVEPGSFTIHAGRTA